MAPGKNAACEFGLRFARGIGPTDLWGVSDLTIFFFFFLGGVYLQ